LFCSNMHDVRFLYLPYQAIALSFCTVLLAGCPTSKTRGAVPPVPSAPVKPVAVPTPRLHRGLNLIDEDNEVYLQKLPSGKEVEVFDIGTYVSGRPGIPPAHSLSYRTNFRTEHNNREERAALLKEVDEIWKGFQPEVGESGRTRAMIWAHHNLTRSHSTSQGFIWVKNKDGTWRALHRETAKGKR
jgi:hypothetical protein